MKRNIKCRQVKTSKKKIGSTKAAEELQNTGQYNCMDGIRKSKNGRIGTSDAENAVQRNL